MGIEFQLEVLIGTMIMIAPQQHYHHRHGGGCRAEHARPPAGEGNDYGDRDRGPQSDARIDVGNDRKAAGFGNKRKRDNDPGQNVGSRVRQPIAAKRGDRDRSGLQLSTCSTAIAGPSVST